MELQITEFDHKCKCGPEFVCVRIIENCDELKIGNIWVQNNVDANGRLAHCIIESIGEKAKEEYGIDVGDYVMIDRLSTFAHTVPVALLRYNNVIVKTNKDRSEFYPLKNMIFVEPDEKGTISKVGKIYIADYQDRLNVGTVTKMNVDSDKNVPCKVGDKVMLTKGADAVELGQTTLYIYKYDMIVCTVED